MYDRIVYSSSIHARSLGSEGRVDSTNLDVGVNDRSIRVSSLDGGRKASSRIAGPADSTRASGTLRECAVEPVHGHGGIIPDGQDEHHLLQLLSHLGQTALGLEVVGVVEGSLLLCAEVFGDAVGGVDTGDARHAVGDGLSALDIEALDFNQGACVGTVVCDELCDQREGLGGVDGHARAVEVQVAHAVGVEVAAALVAIAIAAGVTIATSRGVSATGLTIDSARVRSQGSSNRVGLPVCSSG